MASIISKKWMLSSSRYPGVLLPGLTILPFAIKVLFYTGCMMFTRVTVSSLLQAHRDAHFNVKPLLKPAELICLSGELAHHICRTGVYDYKSNDKGDKNRRTTIGAPTNQCIYLTEGNHLYILLNVKNKQRCLSTKYIFIPNKTTEKVLHKEK